MAWQAHSRWVAPVRVLMVDDHVMLTEALTARLSAVQDLWVVGRYMTDDPDLADAVERLRPDVITIEVESAGSATRALIERLSAAWPAARLVVLTSSHDLSRAVDAARAGVDAWVPKEHGADELIDVLHGVCQGRAWFPPEVLGVVLRELREDVVRARDSTSPLDILSKRERDVLASMVEGKRSDAIAEDLRISTDTVRTHTRSILAKLQVHSRLEAVAIARDAGMGEDQAGGERPTLLPFDRRDRPDD